MVRWFSWDMFAKACLRAFWSCRVSLKKDVFWAAFSAACAHASWRLHCSGDVAALEEEEEELGKGVISVICLESCQRRIECWGVASMMRWRRALPYCGCSEICTKVSRLGLVQNKVRCWKKRSLKRWDDAFVREDVVSRSERVLGRSRYEAMCSMSSLGRDVNVILFVLEERLRISRASLTERWTN